jgi:hypothetical protein
MFIHQYGASKNHPNRSYNMTVPANIEVVLAEILSEQRAVNRRLAEVQEYLGMQKPTTPNPEDGFWTNGMSIPDERGAVRLEYVEKVLRPKYANSFAKHNKTPIPMYYFVPDILINDVVPNASEEMISRLSMNTGVAFDQATGKFKQGTGGGDMRQNRAGRVVKQKAGWPFYREIWNWGDDYSIDTFATSRTITQLLPILGYRCEQIVTHPGDFGGFLSVVPAF